MQFKRCFVDLKISLRVEWINEGERKEEIGMVTLNNRHYEQFFSVSKA